VELDVPPHPLTLRLYGDLAELAGASEVEVPVGEPRSVKDAVESVGVPHTEIGLLRVEGRSVGFDAKVAAGTRVEVYPAPLELAPDDAVALRPAPPDPRRFVADVHLGTLARRLRTLGFDTWWSNDADDAVLARIAIADGRILLTRDRQLLMRREVVHGHLPRSPDPEVQLAEVVARFGLADRAAPLTRCIRCNGPLAPVAKAEVLAVLPPATRREHDSFTRCRDCRQVYWPGSHLTALRTIIDGTI
jgi:uncharacterized protein with PIN domain